MLDQQSTRVLCFADHAPSTPGLRTSAAGISTPRIRTATPTAPSRPPCKPKPERVTAIDIIVPLILSLFCGIGGFGWGLLRLVQGHKKPGTTAMLVNLGVWAAGIALWLAGIAIMAAVGASVKPAP